MKVLLTGANGQLGRCIQDRLPDFWSLKAVNHAQLDISNKKQIELIIKNFQPDVIINAAAYTAVDKAEQEPEKADLVNHIGVKYLAELSQQYHICLIHISTDYVFDGQKCSAYIESDTPNPINVYGKTKLLGEQAVLQYNPSSIIIRTSWVFSEHGNNFVKTMLKLAKERSQLSVINDQFGCPTYADDLAKTIISIIEENNIRGGIYHYCGDSSVSWYEFANAIFKQAKNLNKLPHPIVIHPISTAEYPTLAKRPKYSIMNNQKITAYALQSSDWNKALTNVIKYMDN